MRFAHEQRWTIETDRRDCLQRWLWGQKHFATFDMVEKVPGWIGLISFVAGILALYVQQFEQKHVSAAFLMHCEQTGIDASAKRRPDEAS